MIIYCKNISFNVRILGGFVVFLILIVAIPMLDLAFLGFGMIEWRFGNGCIQLL